jgi:uncharacterized lipoprotein YmbA
MNLIRRSLLAGAALGLLAACSSGPPPRLMLLSNDAAPPVVDAATLRPLLVVRTVALPEYLDRRAVIYRSSDAELTPFADVVWSERLGQSVTRWIAVQLAAELPDQEVQAFSAGGERSPQRVLNLELRSFEPELQAGAPPVLHLRGSWQLSGGGSAVDGELAADVPMTTLDAAATVAAMRVALVQASSSLVAQLRRIPPAQFR